VPNSKPITTPETTPATEGDAEDLQPEVEQAAIYGAVSEQVQSFEDAKPRRQSNRE